MNKSQEAKQLAVFGRRMAEVRKSHGLTQQELAEKLDITLVSIAYIETGKRWPRLWTLHRIADTLDMKLGDILKTL